MKKIESAWINRFSRPLPEVNSNIAILTNDGVFKCEWNPYDADTNANNSPGYLGTAKVIEGQYKGIGFHAWAQSQSEFVMYKII